MARNDFAVDINRPAKDIFPMLVGDNLTRWVQGLVKVEQPGEMRVGAKFRHIYRDRGVDHIELVGEVTAYQPEDYLAYRTVADENGTGFTTEAEYRLRETGGHTHLEYRSQSTYHGSFYVRLMSPLVTWMGQRQLKKDMLKLKSLVEGK